MSRGGGACMRRMRRNGGRGRRGRGPSSSMSAPGGGIVVDWDLHFGNYGFSDWNDMNGTQTTTNKQTTTTEQIGWAGGKIPHPCLTHRAEQRSQRHSTPASQQSNVVARTKIHGWSGIPERTKHDRNSSSPLGRILWLCNARCLTIAT